jgi:competence protein ComEC
MFLKESKLKLRLTNFVVFLIFIVFYLFRLYSIRPPNIPDQAKIRLVGRVVRQPYLKGSNQIINVNGFLVRTDRFPTYFYGQKLEVVGRPERQVINRFQTKFIFYYPAIQVVEEKSSLINKINLTKLLYAFKNRLESLLEKVMPEPQASLLLGILLGSKREMPSKFFQNLQETGTLHVVVASGYNITVVAGFLVASLVKFVNRRKALVWALLGVLTYTLMAGAEPPVVRAAIMGSLTYLAQFLGREKDAVVCLFFAAAVMLLISPLMLLDIGFQLSFLATAGILFIYPKLGGKVFEMPLLGDELRVTLAAQIGTLPILIFNFGQVSFISPLINALVLPVVPLIMGLGAGVVGVGLFIQPLGQILAWFAWVPLTYFVKLIEWFGSLPWVSFAVGQLSWRWLFGYYLVLSLWVLKKQKLFSSA